MTITQAIERADALIPNTVSHPDKLRALSTLDGRIRRELIDRFADAPDEPFLPYEDREPPDLGAALTVGVPYDDVYVYYLAAEIARAEGENDRMNEMLVSFRHAYASFAADYYTRHSHRGGSFHY